MLMKDCLRAIVFNSFKNSFKNSFNRFIQMDIDYEHHPMVLRLTSDGIVIEKMLLYWQKG